MLALANGKNYAILNALSPNLTSFSPVHHAHITFISSSEFTAFPISPFRTHLPVFFPCPSSHSYYSALHNVLCTPQHQTNTVSFPSFHSHMSLPVLYFAVNNYTL